MPSEPAAPKRSLIEKLEVTVLIDDSKNPEKPNLSAQHGVSFLARAKIGKSTISILMDTGPSAATLKNAVKLNVDLSKIDVVVLSHGHYDHTNGLLHVLNHTKKQVPVVVHPKAFNPKFDFKPHLTFIGPAFTPSDIVKARGIPLFASNPVKIAEGIMTTGEVERATSFEKVGGFWTVENGRFVKDYILDDQALTVNLKDKGLVVLTGCAHSGIINTIKHAEKITGIKKVYAVIGGFHLLKADKDRIKATAKMIGELNVELLGPCHCTGSKATSWLQKTLGEKCRPLKTGDVLQL